MKKILAFLLTFPLLFFGCDTSGTNTAKEPLEPVVDQTAVKTNDLEERAVDVNLLESEISPLARDGKLLFAQRGAKDTYHITLYNGRFRKLGIFSEQERSSEIVKWTNRNPILSHPGGNFVTLILFQVKGEDEVNEETVRELRERIRRREDVEEFTSAQESVPVEILFTDRFQV